MNQPTDLPVAPAAEPAQAPTADLPTLLLEAQRLHNLRTWSSDEAGWRAQLQRQPNRADVMQALGTLAAERQHHDEAVAWLRAAVVARPGQAAAHVALAQELRSMGLNAEATTHFDRAVALNPADHAAQLMARLHRAVALDELGHNAQALALFEKAAQQHPTSVDAWAALAMAQQHAGDFDNARLSFQRALQRDSTRLDVLEKFGMLLQDRRQYEDAALVFERLLALSPTYLLAAGRLMHAKMLGADWTALEVLQQRIEVAVGLGQLAAEPFGIQGYCADPETLLRCAQVYSAAYHPDRSAGSPKATVGLGPKIRIGYVAGEFRNQATAVLLTQVLELHDRERFEIYAFDNGWDDGGELRRRIEACVPIVSIRYLDNQAAAAAVRERQIDILVNLNGHFGRARQGLFALRPAAIQVNYLGFPGTIGAPYIDYLVADATAIPPADDPYYMEQVVRLPDSYQPNDATRVVGTEPSRRDQVGLPDGAFVFCCMNNVYKIMPQVFAVWMRLLQRVPNSVLWLYSDVPETQDNLRREAQERGVDGSRIVFGGPLPQAHHLARLRLADVFLDTWPYNAHTTGSDALWAGLPVLTCTGATFPSRVGASLLRAVGLPELVTNTFADYEALAVRLATEPGLLKGLRVRLAAQLTTAPLYDTPRTTRHLENVYIQMVDRARAGLPPTSFACAK
jgi:protein O-GlcNAc transferase